MTVERVARSGLRRLALILCIGAGLPSLAEPARADGRSDALLRRAGQSAARVTADTARTRGELRRYMVDFFRVWRAAWLEGKPQLRRAPIGLSPEDKASFVELDIIRRSLYAACATNFSLGSGRNGQQRGSGLPNQRIAYRFQSSEFAVPRWILGPRGEGTGAVCVDWMPAYEHREDESNDIDRALAVAVRPKVRQARTMLLRMLENGARLSPDDPWITGQLVRFLIDQRQPDAAYRAAGKCRGAHAFCAALLGLAEYRRDSLAAAERAFRAVDSIQLATERGAGRCEAEELSMLRDRTSRELGGLPCPTRAEYVQRLWWLADPLWSDSGNQRYIEHHARRIGIDLHAVTSEDERFTWESACRGEAHRQQVMRYGWPSHVWFDSTYRYRSYRSMEAQPCPDMPGRAMEYMISRVPLVPDWEAILDPFTATSANWLLERPPGVSPQAWWPVEHMPLAHALRPMPEGQLAYFRRDTMVQLALAIDGPTATLRPNMANAALSVLVASTGPTHQAILDQREMLPEETLRWAGLVTGAPMVLSAELLGRDPEEPHQRLRRGTRPPAPLSRMPGDSIGVSDPVLLDTPVGPDGGALPFDSVLATLRGSTSVAPGELLTLYWESYGIAPDDTVDIEVRLVERGTPGVARRAAALIGIGSVARDSVTVAWREPARGHPVTRVDGARATLGRAIGLRLGASDPGEYEMVVQMRRLKGGTARGIRNITIRPPATR